MLRICHLPAFNRVWTDLNASQAFDYSTQDFDTCWKGSCFVGKVLAKPRLQLKLTVVSGIPTPTTAPQKYACTLPFTLQCLSRYIQAFVWATKAYVPELRPYHQFAPVLLFILITLLLRYGAQQLYEPGWLLALPSHLHRLQLLVGKFPRGNIFSGVPWQRSNLHTAEETH